METKVKVAIIGAVSAAVVAAIAIVPRIQNGEQAPAIVKQPDPPASAPVQPILISIEFHSHTNDDNKDKDTGVYVYITTSDGQTTLGQIENADNSSRDATEYNDHSDHSLRLVVTAPGVTKDACKGFRARVRQTTNGNDTWKFNGKVVLRFSDGTTLQNEKNDIVLKNDGAQDSF
jgi:hypothetical protein